MYELHWAVRILIVHTYIISIHMRPSAYSAGTRHIMSTYIYSNMRFWGFQCSVLEMNLWFVRWEKMR